MFIPLCCLWLQASIAAAAPSLHSASPRPSSPALGPSSTEYRQLPAAPAFRKMHKLAAAAAASLPLLPPLVELPAVDGGRVAAVFPEVPRLAGGTEGLVGGTESLADGMTGPPFVCNVPAIEASPGELNPLVPGHLGGGDRPGVAPNGTVQSKV